MLKGFLANIKLIIRITIFVSAYEKNCNKTFVDEKKDCKKVWLCPFYCYFCITDVLSNQLHHGMVHKQCCYDTRFALLSRGDIHGRDVKLFCKSK